MESIIYQNVIKNNGLNILIDRFKLLLFKKAYNNKQAYHTPYPLPTWLITAYLTCTECPASVIIIQIANEGLSSIVANTF